MSQNIFYLENNLISLGNIYYKLFVGFIHYLFYFKFFFLNKNKFPFLLPNINFFLIYYEKLASYKLVFHLNLKFFAIKKKSK